MRGLMLLTAVVPLMLVGCQQATTPVTPLTQASQAHQIASLIAGTRYLKNQCAYPGLPADGQIELAAYKAADRRGWQLTSGVAERSEQLYQQLLHDATPQAIQCQEFRQLLQPFITTLPKA
ncbi:type II secretion system pilot lipoprotein GspS [Mixta intestinalis]|jgi:general secretion pathway protein S|uniref:Pullulanase secretion protein PulS n=1 Tax=Mixta intestinalis TaxID=1615494 RepID=A0A6P1PVX2_9GAMM|nr:type II secretion system pilot lipoprotein GspS [Mixta intestinalis]QHM70212.1 Pullulanase secretion protein PulS [Mixta intestinalis]